MGKPCVLLAEDDGDLRQLYSFILLDMGIEVQEANSGTDALDLLKKCQPDLLLTDVMMPVMNGLELIGRIRADEKWKSLPILVVSAHPDYLARAYAAGANEMLRKPAAADLLRAAIRRNLSELQPGQH
jgi:CheY-like chemotaxis protein